MPQIVSPSVPSGPATIIERYDALVASGRIERDPAQEGVVAVLDALAVAVRREGRNATQRCCQDSGQDSSAA
jgi:predicted ATPase